MPLTQLSAAVAATTATYLYPRTQALEFGVGTLFTTPSCEQAEQHPLAA